MFFYLQLVARHLPEILKLHKVFSKRSEDCLYPSRQTICHTMRILSSTHNFHVSEAGIYLVCLHLILPHLSFPYQLPAILLQIIKFNMNYCTQTVHMGNHYSVPKQGVKRTKIYLIQLPVGQKPNENICDPKSCCCSCRPSLRSHDRTVLSKPPVHSLVPSALISIQDAPSV